MWRLPTKILLDRSGLSQLPQLISQNITPKVSSALIVTDNKFKTNTSISWIDNASSVLRKTLGCNVNIYDSSSINPRIETDITTIALQHESDIIISIAGGLPIFYVGALSPCESVLTKDENIRINHINDTISVSDESILPTTAVIDCDALRNIPTKLISWTAMDALTRALEAYTCNCSSNISNEFAVKAIDLLFDYVPSAVNKIKKNREHREKYAIVMASIASIYAEMASTYAGYGTGAVHCLSQSLGGKYDIQRGLANSAVLYCTMKYHQAFIKDKLSELCCAIHIENKMIYKMLMHEVDGGQAELKGLDGDDLFLLCLDRLRSEIGYVRGLKAFNQLDISQNDWRYIAEECVMNDSNYSNPQTMNESNYIELLAMLQNDAITSVKKSCHGCTTGYCKVINNCTKDCKTCTQKCKSECACSSKNVSL